NKRRRTLEGRLFRDRDDLETRNLAQPVVLAPPISDVHEIPGPPFRQHESLTVHGQASVHHEQDAAAHEYPDDTRDRSKTTWSHKGHDVLALEITRQQGARDC